MDGTTTCSTIINRVTETFHTADYVVFALSLALSALIGIYFAWVDRNKSADDYMMGGRSVGPLPIACSLATTFFSAVTVLGTPVEYYQYGTMFTYFLITYLLCSILIAELFGPLYHDLGITSTYEYLEARFSRSVRLHISFVFIVQNLIYIAIVIYGPALALETTTGLDRWLAVWVSGAVCIFYTSIGGLKAVVWTDTLQIIFMFAGFLSIIVDGAITFDGFDKILEIGKEGGRMVWDDFSFDPRRRHSFWSIVFGGTFGIWGSFFCVTQSYTQRMLACGSKRDMRISVYLGYIGVAAILIMAGLTGLTAYAHYQCCDPLEAGWISSRDQLIPYLALDRFRDNPGAASLFVVGAYGGTLSTVSSGINSMATVLISDFIRPFESHITWFKPSDRNYTILVKLASLIFGIGCISLTYMVESLGSGILQAALSINGILGGPTLGIFFMGALMPMVNKWGAHLGYCVGVAISIWNYVGSLNYPPSPAQTRVLSQSIDSCNQTQVQLELVPIAPVNITYFDTDNAPPIANFYAISYLYLGTVALVCCILTAIPVSILTGGQPNLNRYTVRNIWKYMPAKAQRILSCGTFPEKDAYSEAEGEVNKSYATNL